MNILTTSATSVRATESTWQAVLRGAYRRPADLALALQLPEDWAVEALPAAGEFPLFAPQPFVGRIQPGNVRDPLLLQIWPQARETHDELHYTQDPVGDQAAKRRPGLLQKYYGRALLVLTGACAVHCRYCFRRHWNYSESPHGLRQWLPVIDQLREDPSIEEVILSGGDPWMLPDALLDGLMEKLAEIAHVRRVRFHTRMPIAIPQRVTEELLDALTRFSFQTIVVVHANHSQELDGAVAESIGRLTRRRIPVFNQSVLLAGVNDRIEDLVELSQALMGMQIIPYYLHQLDRVAGAAHWNVPLDRGRGLHAEMRRRLPGYMVPRFVVEEPGAPGKTWLI